MDIETEVETLKSIYEDCINYENNQLQCKIKDEREENQIKIEGEITITFQIPEAYPEELPTFVLDSEEGYIINEFEKIEEEIREIIDNEFTCIFELVDKVKEMLGEIMNNQMNAINEEIIEKEKEEERKREEEIYGTTNKTFDEWWKEKEKERDKLIEKIKKEKEGEMNRKKGKLTGKQIFMNNPRLHEQFKEEENKEIEKTLEEQGVELEMFTDDLDI